MKRFLLSFLMASLCSFLFAQTTTNLPCFQSFNVTKNGAGQARPFPGYLTRSANALVRSGEIQIVFSFAVPTGVVPPAITALYGPLPSGSFLTIEFYPISNLNGGLQTTTYEYYTERSNSNLFNGNGSLYNFTIQYAGQTGTTTCTNVENIPPPTTLPVSFKSFSATRNQGSVSLKWETASEQNNKGFYVQRSLGNGEWKDVGFVFSSADRGNSSAALSYSLNDLNINKGISQYRLLQVDIDGHGKYSEIRSVRGQDEAGKLLVYPNPSNTGNVNILFEDATAAKDVMVNDLAGRTIKQYSSVSGSIEVKGLKSGFYTIKVLDRTTGTATIQKVIVNQK